MTSKKWGYLFISRNKKKKSPPPPIALDLIKFTPKISLNLILFVIGKSTPSPPKPKKKQKTKPGRELGSFFWDMLLSTQKNKCFCETIVLNSHWVYLYFSLDHYQQKFNFTVHQQHPIYTQILKLNRKIRNKF